MGGREAQILNRSQIRNSPRPPPKLHRPTNLSLVDFQTGALPKNVNKNSTHCYFKYPVSQGHLGTAKYGNFPSEVWDIDINNSFVRFGLHPASHSFSGLDKTVL